MAEPGLKLPAEIVSWMEEVTGAPVTKMDRVPGGASREAWFIDVKRPDGSTEELFLRYSRAARGPEGGPGSPYTGFLPLHREAEVFLALQDTEVTVPRVLAVHPEKEAMLAERVPGETWFYRIKDPDEQVRVAQDFIRNLAALHRLDPRELALASFQPVRSIREHALEEVGAMRLRAESRGELDPLLRVSLDWLERNVPDYDGPTLLIQGDTGPGNFMYHEGRVTAVVDWELAHLGDPMDDIAWLSLRTVQDTFTHFPDRLAEYEALSGYEIDPERVWYYRLYAETRLAAGAAAPPSSPQQEEKKQGGDAPVVRDPGNALIYGILHRRLMIEALAQVIGLDLPPRKVEEEGELREHAYLYDTILDTLQVVVPRIEDRLASQWSKGIARVVKYLKEIDRSGALFAERELEDIGGLLGRRSDGLAEGRKALAEAAREGVVSDQDYVLYMWRQVVRDDHLLRLASGALHQRTWPPLSRAQGISNGAE